MGMRKVKKVEYQKAVRTFTDRMPLREAFKKKYEYAKVNLNEDVGPCVLSFYGIGGIGKTSLLCTLAKEFKAENPNAMCVYHNIEHDTTATPIEILKRLREKISSDYNFSFNFFDRGYYYYENKIGEKIEKPEISSFIGKSKLLSYVTEVAKDAPLVGTIAIVLDAVDKGQAMLRNFLKESKNEFTSIADMEQNKLEEKLPYWFAMDMEHNLEKSTEPFVFFIDTYEKHVNELNSTGKALKADLWLRNENGPIRNISKAMWVISGREKLKWNDTASQITTCGWEEADENNLEQHLVGALSESDSCLFLSNCNIDNDELRKAIYKLTGGIPVYLDLCVTQYENLMSRGKSPAIDDFGNDIQCLIDRMTQYMNDEEQQIVYILSCLKKWDYDLFINVAKAFGMSIINDKYDALMSMSFINEDSNEKDYYYIDRVVRELLFKKCNERTKKTALKAAIDYCLEHREEKPVHYASMMMQYAVDYYEDDEALNDFYVDNLKEFLIDLTGPEKDSASKAYEIFKPFSERSDKNENNKLYLNKLEFNYYYCKAYGEINEAFDIANKATALSDKLYDYEYTVVHGPLRCLADAYYWLQNYEKSSDLHKEIFEKRKFVLGENDFKTLIAMYDLAHDYFVLKNYEESFELHKNFILNTISSESLIKMSKIAKYYFRLGKKEKAIALYKKIIEKQKFVFSENLYELSYTMNNLADIYYELSEYEEAIKLYCELSEINKTIWNENHPNVSEPIKKLADIYQRIDKKEEALALRKEVLKKHKVFWGENHFRTLYAAYELILSYLKLDNCEEADALHKDIVEKRKSNLYGNTSEPLRMMYEYANEYFNIGWYEDAFELHKNYLEKEKTLLSKDLPNNLISMKQIAEDYYKYCPRKTSYSFEIYKEIIEIEKTVFGKNHSEVFNSMNRLINIYCECGKYEEAIELQKEVIEKLEATLGENHPDTLKAIDNLASTYCYAEKYEESLYIFKELYIKSKDVFGEENEFTKKIADTICELKINVKNNETEEYLNQAMHIISTFVEYRNSGKNKEMIDILKELRITAENAYGKEDEIVNKLTECIHTIEQNNT